MARLRSYGRWDVYSNASGASIMTSTGEGKKLCTPTQLNLPAL